MKLVLWGIIVLGITAYLVWSSEREEEKEELNRHHAWVKREVGRAYSRNIEHRVGTL